MDYAITTLVSDEPWSENCYCVRHVSSGRTIVIDPGGNAERIIQALQEAGGRLEAILLTHAHHDHVGAVAQLRQRFDVPCFLHRADNRLLKQAHTYALVFAGRAMEPVADVTLFDDVPVIDQWPIKALHTPGHSPGSVCYGLGNVVFTGDTLLYQHVGRADTPGSDPEQLATSIDQVLVHFADDIRILSGHGRAWTIGEAKEWWQEARIAPPQYKQFGGI